MYFWCDEFVNNKFQSKKFIKSRKNKSNLANNSKLRYFTSYTLEENLVELLISEIQRKNNSNIV